MKKQQSIKIGMSLALATVLSMAVTGCGSSSDDATSAASTAVDVTVERGKVYDANVTDSSTPLQYATQKAGKNVYTFAKAPVYPVVVNGGWIDVNNDGAMDASDVKLDIQMKSYTTTVTPITTVMATFATKADRDIALQSLADALNAGSIGSDIQVTLEDLLKVPSEAPRDVMVVSNATFKDMKEKSTSRPELSDVMGQFTTINAGLADGATFVDAEQAVMSSLESQSLVEKVSSQDILEFKQELANSVTPESATVDLSGYHSIYIYKNVSAQYLNLMTSSYQNQPGFTTQSTSSSTSCEGFGFSNPTTTTSSGVSKVYFKTTSDGVFSCGEIDYGSVTGLNGSNNALVYYDN